MEPWNCPSCGHSNETTALDEDLLGPWDPDYVWDCGNCEKAWQWSKGQPKEFVYGS